MNKPNSAEKVFAPRGFMRWGFNWIEGELDRAWAGDEGVEYLSLEECNHLRSQDAERIRILEEAFKKYVEADEALERIKGSEGER